MLSWFLYSLQPLSPSPCLFLLSFSLQLYISFDFTQNNKILSMLHRISFLILWIWKRNAAHFREWKNLNEMLFGCWEICITNSLKGTSLDIGLISLFKLTAEKSRNYAFTIWNPIKLRMTLAVFFFILFFFSVFDLSVAIVFELKIFSLKYFT